MLASCLALNTPWLLWALLPGGWRVVIWPLRSWLKAEWSPASSVPWLAALPGWVLALRMEAMGQ